MPEAQLPCAPASCSGLPSRKGHSLLLTFLSSFLILCVNLRSPEPENFLLGREAQLLLARVKEQAEESTHIDSHVQVWDSSSPRSSGSPSALSCLGRQTSAVWSSLPQWPQDLHPPLSGEAEGGGAGMRWRAGRALLSEDPLCGPGAWRSACELVLGQPGGGRGPPGGIAGRQVAVVPLRGSTFCCKTGRTESGQWPRHVCLFLGPCPRPAR